MKSLGYLANDLQKTIFEWRDPESEDQPTSKECQEQSLAKSLIHYFGIGPVLYDRRTKEFLHQLGDEQMDYRLWYWEMLEHIKRSSSSVYGHYGTSMEALPTPDVWIAWHHMEEA